MPTATKSIVASISVTIEGGTTESVLNAESNDCVNDSKTSFTKGDTYKFLVFKSDDVKITTQFATYGSVSGPTKQINLPQTEVVKFSNPKEGTASLGKPADGGFTSSWLGNHTADGLSLSPNKSSVIVSTLGFGVAKIEYTTKAYVHELSIPANLPDDVKEIDIFIVGEAPDPDAQQCPTL